VWAALELVPGEPRPLKGVKVHEIKATAPIHEGITESGCPNKWVDNEGGPSRLRDAIWVVRLVKIVWGFGPAEVLQDRHAHGIDGLAGEFELVA
jgi:hypothetical protein